MASALPRATASESDAGGWGWIAQGCEGVEAPFFVVVLGRPRALEPTQTSLCASECPHRPPGYSAVLTVCWGWQPKMEADRPAAGQWQPEHPAEPVEAGPPIEGDDASGNTPPQPLPPCNPSPSSLTLPFADHRSPGPVG